MFQSPAEICFVLSICFGALVALAVHLLCKDK